VALLDLLLRSPVPEDQASRYDARLMPVLKTEHQLLLSMLGQVRSFHEVRDLDCCRAALKQFQRRLREHLVVEDWRLYVHVDTVMATGNPAAAEIAWRVQHEARDIIGAIGDLLARYGGDGEAVLQPRFAEELASFEAVLAARLRLEEQVVFPMYLPPESADWVDSTLWHNFGFR
jgi:hemerythrin-like domain-containing protein